MNNENEWDDLNPQKNEEEKPKRTKARKPGSGNLAIGIILVGLVAVLAFSAITGLFVFIFSNKDRFVRESQSTPVLTEPSQTGPTGTRPGAQPTETAGTEPAFQLPDLALPAPQEGKELLTIPQIVDKVKPAILAIYTDVVVADQFGGLSQNTVSGSGFIITADGYAVTNAHVIENARSIHVSLEDGRSYEAKLVGSDEYADVAVLKMEATDLPYVSLGDSSKLLIGELAIAIGNPTGRLSGTVTSGIISALDRELSQSPIALIQTDAALNPGNSGGALINAYGEVIGINQLKIMSSGSGSTDQIQGISFAIPVNAAKPIIESIIRTGRHVWPMMGITASTVEQNLAGDQGIHYPGVVVVTVEPGSAAAQAGLRVGDVITRFAGTEVKTTRELTDRKNQHKAGDRVTLTIYRGSQTLTLEMVLGASS